MRATLNRAFVGVAYAVSAIAALLHVHAAWINAPVPDPLGMRVLTYTFVALVFPLAAITRGQPGSRRAVWITALAAFTVSALQLSQLHQDDSSWPVELLGHHASLPLAFAILYQDYPFALADLFLKRALALLAIVTVAFAALATFGAQSAAFAQFVRADPGQVGILVTLWVGTALLYPALRRVTAWFVDAVVLHRPNYRSLRAELSREVQAHDDVSTLLSAVCERLASSLSAQSVTWRVWRVGHADDTLGPTVLARSEAAALLKTAAAHVVSESGDDPDPVAALVTVPTNEAPQYVIAIAHLTGGRRFLSDDLTTLEAVALLLARRIDAIRVTHERYERELREREIGKLATEAELRALRAQINPHFLFNALTTIGYLIEAAPARALETLMRLTTLLRAVLRSEGASTTLGRELEIVESYLDIEHARFEERLRVTIDVPLRLRKIWLPPLVLQPLVENAVKHGIGRKQVGGEIIIRATIDGVHQRDRQLSLIVRDTGAGATPEALRRGREAGVGLQNVTRRLEGQYGDKASLTIHSAPGEGTQVEIRLPVEFRVGEPRHVSEVVM